MLIPPPAIDMRGPSGCWVPTLTEAYNAEIFGDVDEPYDRHYHGDIAMDPFWFWMYYGGSQCWGPLTPVKWS